MMNATDVDPLLSVSVGICLPMKACNIISTDVVAASALFPRSGRVLAGGALRTFLSTASDSTVPTNENVR